MGLIKVLKLNLKSTNMIAEGGLNIPWKGCYKPTPVSSDAPKNIRSNYYDDKRVRDGHEVT